MHFQENLRNSDRSRQLATRLVQMAVGSIVCTYSSYALLVTERTSLESAIAVTAFGISLIAMSDPVIETSHDLRSGSRLISETEDYLRQAAEDGPEN